MNAVQKGLRVILAGRNESALHAQSFKTGFPYEVVDLSDEQSVIHLLEKGAVVIHCGGPFAVHCEAYGRSLPENKNALYRHYRRT